MTKHSAKKLPDWANELIFQLKRVEIYLGNLPKTPGWQSEQVDSLSGRSFHKDDEVFDEHKTELIFQRICAGLNQGGFTASEIAMAVNATVCYEGGPAYCNEEEVRQVLDR